MATEATRSGPVVIAYDGTAAAEHALREAGPLLGGRPALVVTVWKEGLGFELAEDPSMLGIPPAPIDVRTAMEIDQAMQERAQRMAQHGANLAAETGFSHADGLAMADDPGKSIAETVVDLADERDAQAIVVGAHNYGRLSEAILGSTAREVVRRATCPVLVVRERSG
jgi:nucleotide-binding universal stress UspA family protein